MAESKSNDNPRTEQANKQPEIDSNKNQCINVDKQEKIKPDKNIKFPENVWLSEGWKPPKEEK